MRSAAHLTDADDAEWDAFVAAIPGGPYPQSSGWAKVKSRVGWRLMRVVVRDGQDIVAGAQLLLRPLAGFGSIGYAPKGPLIPAGDVALAGQVLDTLLMWAARQGVRYLALQPPSSDEVLERELAARGIEPTADIGVPNTTLRIDLTQSVEDLLADMNESTRRNIRRGQSHGVVVRMGNDGDIDAFVRLMATAARRKGYTLPPLEYYFDMWRIFGEGRHVALLVAEVQDELVCAMLAITFGDTVFAHASAWTGSHAASKPNHVLEWATIQWAKERGYRYFDVEGVNPKIVRALDDGAPKALIDMPDSHATRFKVGFGGQLTTLSSAYDYLPNPMLRWAYRRLYPRLKGSRAVNAIQSTVMRRIRAQRSPDTAADEPMSSAPSA